MSILDKTKGPFQKKVGKETKNQDAAEKLIF